MPDDATSAKVSGLVEAVHWYPAGAISTHKRFRHDFQPANREDKKVPPTLVDIQVNAGCEGGRSSKFGSAVSSTAFNESSPDP